MKHIAGDTLRRDHDLEVDVVVVGSGPAGSCAALACEREHLLLHV